MRIRTIEDDFEYQVKQVLNDVKENLIDMDVFEEGEDLTDEILWDNKELLGEMFYNRIYEAIGFDSVGVVEQEI